MESESEPDPEERDPEPEPESESEPELEPESESESSSNLRATAAEAACLVFNVPLSFVGAAGVAGLAETRLGEEDICLGGGGGFGL